MAYDPALPSALDLHLRAGPERARRIDDDDLAGLQAAGHLNRVGHLDANQHVAALGLVVHDDEGLRLRRIGSVAQQRRRRHRQAVRHVAHLHLRAREQPRDELRSARNADDDFERAASRIDLRRDAVHFAFGHEARQRVDGDDDASRRPSPCRNRPTPPTSGTRTPNRRRSCRAACRHSTIVPASA